MFTANHLLEGCLLQDTPTTPRRTEGFDCGCSRGKAVHTGRRFGSCDNTARRLGHVISDHKLKSPEELECPEQSWEYTCCNVSDPPLYRSLQQEDSWGLLIFFGIVAAVITVVCCVFECILPAICGPMDGCTSNDTSQAHRDPHNHMYMGRYVGRRGK